MSRIFLWACLVMMAGTAAVRAQECDRSDDTQQMMNICAGEDYQASDASLNAAYQNLAGASDAEGRKLLQAAQRAWIAFRDAECARSTAASEGGSLHPLEMSQCLTRLTDERIKQLAGASPCEDGEAGCAAPGDETDEEQ
jgi:uncharacterized protein YecT (DUF1311 family)